MRVVGIIQARMGSTRLPGKVLKALAGRPLLQRILDNLTSSTKLAATVVATSDAERDDAIVDYCRRQHVGVCRGSETNVLQRTIAAAVSHRADVVVRLTADNPCVTGDLVDRAIEEFEAASPPADYAHTVHGSGWPYGLAVEVIRRAPLETALANGDGDDREHVTLYVRKRPQLYRHVTVPSPVDFSAVSLTVDTPEDFAFVEGVCQRLDRRSRTPSVADVFATLEEVMEPTQ